MKRGMRASAGGVTLLEVLVAVTLLSLLTVGMSMAMRLGLFAFSHTTSRLMENRRVTGAQRIVEQQLLGLIPARGPCAGVGGEQGPPTVIFQGLPEGLTMVSGFSLQEAWRGRPQILQFFVIPAEKGGGVRLVVNEIPYAGPVFAGTLCMAIMPDGVTGLPIPQFRQPAAEPTTFVLADHLAYCRFAYQAPPLRPGEPPEWTANWSRGDWPTGIRIEMAPLEANGARLQPITVTAPVYIARDPRVKYEDK